MDTSSSSEVSERGGISDVQPYLTQSGLLVTSSLASLQERLQQYKVVEMKLLAQQRDFRCTSSCSAAGLQELIADFDVSEGIYSRARIEESDSVCLWWGANVMLEYTSDEASALLQKNLDNAKASLQVLIADLQFLRDQVTIPQFTIARVYNWGVHQRTSKQVTATAVEDS